MVTQQTKYVKRATKAVILENGRMLASGSDDVSERSLQRALSVERPLRHSLKQLSRMNSWESFRTSLVILRPSLDLRSKLDIKQHILSGRGLVYYNTRMPSIWGLKSFRVYNNLYTRNNYQEHLYNFIMWQIGLNKKSFNLILFLLLVGFIHKPMFH